MSIDLRPSAEEVTAYAGATLKLAYTVVDASGEPVDLSGAVSRMLLKRSADEPDEDAIAEFSIDDSKAATGEFTATLDAAATGQLSPGIYYADHRITVSDGDIAGEHIVARFVIRIEVPVTRSVA